jgi:hypothetical protein
MPRVPDEEWLCRMMHESLSTAFRAAHYDSLRFLTIE